MTRDEMQFEAALIEFVDAIRCSAHELAGYDEKSRRIEVTADALLAELDKGAANPPIDLSETHDFLPKDELADLRRKAKAFATIGHRILDGHPVYYSSDIFQSGPYGAATLLALAEKISGSGGGD